MNGRRPHFESQLARVLLEGGFVTEGQLRQAEQQCVAEHKPLTAVLQERGWVSAETLTTAVSFHLKLPVADLREVSVSPDAVRLVPEAVAHDLGVLPLSVERDGTLRVLMNDPGDFNTVNGLEMLTNRPVQAVLPIGEGLDELIRRNYPSAGNGAGPRPFSSPPPGPGSVVAQPPVVEPAFAEPSEREQGEPPPIAAEHLTADDDAPSAPAAAPADTGAPAVAGPVDVPHEPQPAAAVGPNVPAASDKAAMPSANGAHSYAASSQALDRVARQGVELGASDTHLRPGRDSAHVSFRVGGVLQEGPTLPLDVHEGVVLRTKAMAGLDAAETRRPQDGRFSLTVGEDEVDFRVFTAPTATGELLVLRPVTLDDALRPLAELGMDTRTLSAFQHALRLPQGMVLVSGPARSGRTTTLYAGLSELVDGQRNVIALEGRAAYRLEGVSQVELDGMSLDSAHGLASVLQLDPDVVLLGDVRDRETAAMAVDAALTGRLVLCATHAYKAPGAVARLTDLDVEPFLAASALVGVLSQRLVRRLCQHCTVLRQPSPLEAIAYEQIMNETAGQFWSGEGCDQCRQTGYSGRAGLFEFMVVSDEVPGLIAAKAPAEEVHAQAVKEGMVPLERAGMLLAKQGVTTISEVMRATFTA